MDETELHPVLKQFIIDPDGDIYLNFSGYEVRVSSKVLSLASPGFKKMFGPFFAEGASVAADNPSRVHLRADDADTLISLCYLLHFQGHKVSDTPTLEFLEKLAILTDKYDCVGSISQWTAFHLTDAAREAEKSTTNGRLLFPAYVFDHPRVFRDVTKHLVYSLIPDGSYRILSSCSEYYGIPKDIAEALPEKLLSMKQTNSLSNAVANLERQVGVRGSRTEGPPT